jgi:hypothetical protein
MELMSLTTVLALIAIVAFGAIQYTLMFNALRDLIRRPRVRGGNKVLWGLTILCLPIAGALIYSWMGPTSFLARDQAQIAPPRRRQASTSASTSAPARNITPISEAPSIRTTRTTSPRTRIRRTGS